LIPIPGIPSGPFPESHPGEPLAKQGSSPPSGFPRRDLEMALHESGADQVWFKLGPLADLFVVPPARVLAECRRQAERQLGMNRKHPARPAAAAKKE